MIIISLRSINISTINKSLDSLVDAFITIPDLNYIPAISIHLPEKKLNKSIALFLYLELPR